MPITPDEGNISQIEESNQDTQAFARAVEAVNRGSEPVVEADKLYESLTDDEKLGLLDGDTPFWIGLRSMVVEGYNVKPYIHGEVARLGIPGIRFVDGPRGCVARHGTAFPVSMARGATWDVTLEEEIGEAIGREIRAQGGNFFGGVCINLPRHPAWGRVQETYGDDPFHLGEFGAALTRGAERYTMACVKHFALNSMENARFKVDVTVDFETLHDVFLPHFKRALDEGASAIMASYNSVNGEWMGQNKYFLTEVLRDLWGFGCVAVTDFIWGIRDGAISLEAGMDVEEPFAQQRATHLANQLDTGNASWADVKRSGVRIIETQLRSYATRNPLDLDESIMACESHRQLARLSAARSMVLLKNDPVGGTPVLPIGNDVTSIAVIGRLATQANLGDHGSSNVRPPGFVSPIEGIRSAFKNAKITLITDDDPEACAIAASEAEVAIIVVGYTAEDEGEYIGVDTMSQPELIGLFPPMPDGFDFFDTTGLKPNESIPPVMSDGQGGDRTSLRLRPIDTEIITRVGKVNKRSVVAIVAAGAVITQEWHKNVPATLIMWYAGMEGGHALADVLSGKENPCGRLPFSIPTSEDHLPFFDPNATSITYDRFHGQRLLDRLGVEAAFPHGFGLSYTTFSIKTATVIKIKDDQVRLQVNVQNTGDRDGRHVIQVYGKRKSGRYSGELMLTGFAVSNIKSGESIEINVDLSLMALAEWDQESRTRIAPDPSDVTLLISSFAHDPDAISIQLVSPDS
ncbi:MAG: family 3 glycosyl hydrolase [Acidimicrobiales bacterium]|nr:family 3 glycosyl hydrolase [Acidimicrobiales bacterium]